MLVSELALVWSYIGQPLWYDEAYTLMYYCSKPFRFIATDYWAPNNHIGFSLIEHAWSLAIGNPTLIRPDTAILRIPSLLLATAGIVAFFLFARRAIDPDPATAALATLLYASQYQVLEFSYQLRGYGPSMAWFGLTLAVAVHARRLSHWLYAAGIVVGIFMANYTVPTNIWFSVPLALGLALAAMTRSEERPQTAPQMQAAAAGDRRIGAVFSRLREPLVLWTIGATLLAFLFTAAAYWPVRQQLAGHSGTDHALPTMIRSLRTGYVEHWSRFLDAVRYIPHRWLTLAAILVGCAALLLHARAHAPARPAAALLVPVALLSMMVAAMTGLPGFSRNYGVAAVFMAPVQFWGVWGPGCWLARRVARWRGETHPATRSIRWAATLSIFLIALGSEVSHRLTYRRDFGPDQAIRTLSQTTSADTKIIYSSDSDAAAINYYAKAYGVIDRCSHYFAVPASYRPKFGDLLIVSTSDKDLDDILKEWGILDLKANLKAAGGQGRYRFHRLLR